LSHICRMRVNMTWFWDFFYPSKAQFTWYPKWMPARRNYF